MKDEISNGIWKKPAWSYWFIGPYYTKSLIGISSSSKEKANIEETKNICFLVLLSRSSRSQRWNEIYEFNF